MLRGFWVRFWILLSLIIILTVTAVVGLLRYLEAT